MPLNQPNLSLYKPNPVGAVRLTTRSSTRARLTLGGTYFRSKEWGELANQLKIGVFVDGPEGIAVVLNPMLKPAEMISVAGMAPIDLVLYKLAIDWFEEVRLKWSGTEWRAEKQGIRWQIAPGPALPIVDLGPVADGLFSSGGVSFKITGLAGWPTGAVVYLRPRTHRYTLVPLSVTDPNTMLVTTGWDIGALRATLNADGLCWITMPARGSAGDPGPPPTPPTSGSDVQDEGVDATFLTAFDMTNMQGGNGLPASPVGLNTGPDRVMVHLNYNEQEDGSMSEFNQVFEWVGDTATIGAWGRYS